MYRTGSQYHLSTIYITVKIDIFYYESLIDMLTFSILITLMFGYFFNTLFKFRYVIC